MDRFQDQRCTTAQQSIHPGHDTITLVYHSVISDTCSSISMKVNNNSSHFNIDHPWHFMISFRVHQSLIRGFKHLHSTGYIVQNCRPSYDIAFFYLQILFLSLNCYTQWATQSPHLQILSSLPTPCCSPILGIKT